MVLIPKHVSVKSVSPCLCVEMQTICTYGSICREAQYQRGWSWIEIMNTLVINAPHTQTQPHLKQNTHMHTQRHSLCNHLPFRGGCGYVAVYIAGCLSSLIWMATTCFTLWQQMVQVPLHYSSYLFLPIYPCLSSLHTCLCPLVSVPLCLCSSLSAPFLPACMPCRHLSARLSLTLWRMSVLCRWQSASLLFPHRCHQIGKGIELLSTHQYVCAVCFRKLLENKSGLCSCLCIHRHNHTYS